jgi:hypothetical protein
MSQLEDIAGMQCFHELADGPDLQVVNVVTARAAIDADHALHLDAAQFRKGPQRFFPGPDKTAKYVSTVLRATAASRAMFWAFTTMHIAWCYVNLRCNFTTNCAEKSNQKTRQTC